MVSFRSLNECAKLSSFVRHLLSKFGDKLKLFGTIEENLLDKKAVGYYPRKDFLYIAYGLPAIEHEIAHMVEINKSRILIPDWGLKIYSRIDKETSSAIVAGIARESRVRGIALHLYSDTYSSVNAISSNPIWAWSMDSRFPFGRFKNRSDLIEWSNNLHEKTYNAWSLDRIETEWSARANYILDWMETS